MEYPVHSSPVARMILQVSTEEDEKEDCPSDETRRVTVCIGPELVKEAAKEAVQGIGFDLLLVCGFAFDPHVSEETKRYGNLNVLPVRMNPDLSMGEELLKKTGAGNLFMVFGGRIQGVRYFFRGREGIGPDIVY
jgi:hypothetical protein